MMDYVIEVTEATFETDVIARSHDLPVLVDFWAPWCGPCRMLTPVLEKLAVEGNGTWVLAKVNSDENPNLSRRFNVRGIPNVKAFKGGRLVDEFTGALPRPQVQDFLKRLLPNQWDKIVDRAEQLISGGDTTTARAELEELIREQPQFDRARLALARVELAEGQREAALTHLAAVPAMGPYGEDARRLQAQARLAGSPASEDTLEGLAERVMLEPTNLDARFELATAAAKLGDYDAAAGELLHILERQRNYGDGAAHRAMLDLFVLLGEEDPRTNKYRQQLGWILFA